MSVGLFVRDVVVRRGDVTLAGMLAVPDRESYAGVVMVGGSGPADRNGYGMFPLIREHLVAAGIAVLCYDKRGVGKSSGHYLDASMADLAGDSLAGLEFLRAQPGVRADAVGLFGHSEGGWLVLHAAAGREDVAFVVTNGCPGMSPAVQVRYALASEARAAGVAQPDMDVAMRVYDAVADAGRRGADYAEARRLIDSVPTAAIFTDYWTDFDERDWEFLKRKQDHDPIPDAVRLRCPYLATFGGADPWVPVVESIERFTDAVCRTGRDDRYSLTIGLYPGADHRLQVDGDRFAPGYLTALPRWIDEQTTTS